MNCLVLGTDPHALGIVAAIHSAGYQVKLWGTDTTEPSLNLRYHGVLGDGHAQVEVVQDLPAAIADADIVIIGGELQDRDQRAAEIGGALSPEQVVLLSPGGAGGALAFAKRVRDDFGHEPAVAEVPGFPIMSAMQGDGSLRVTATKQNLSLGVFPATRLNAVHQRLTPVLPMLTPVESVLETSLANTNTLIHPPVSLLNASLIERGQDFRFYREGYTPGAARIIETIDRERIQLAAALGIDAAPINEVMRGFYGDQGMTGDSIYEQLSTFAPFESSAGPRSLEHRYQTDDIPYGIAPMAALGRQCGVEMPVMSGLVDIWSAICQRDFWSFGHTLEKMGLSGKDAGQIRDYVRTGSA